MCRRTQSSALKSAEAATRSRQSRLVSGQFHEEQHEKSHQELVIMFEQNCGEMPDLVMSGKSIGLA